MANELAHAYIIEGPEGEERDLYLQNFIQKILCESPGLEGRACGFCPSCKRVLAGSHEDVIRMERSGKVAYKVDDAAALMERLAMRPYGTHNVGVINNAEQMSEIVQNKLLKTLEEPYPGTIILLATSNRESLLQTVRSRCVLLRLNDLSEENTSDNDHVKDVSELWGKGCYFYEARNGIEKTLSDQDEALRFLDELETVMRDRLSDESADYDRTLFSIDRIEIARRDILQGMGYKQALKRLYLETK